MRRQDKIPKVYLGRLQAKLQTCCNSKLPNKGIRWIFRKFCGTLNENQLFRTQQNQEGDTDTVYCHGIPLYGKNTMSIFNLTQFLTTCVFSSSKKATEQHINPQVHTLITYSGVCTYHNKKQPTINTEHT